MQCRCKCSIIRCRRLYPDLVVGSGLDSCRAFTVHYSSSREGLGQRHLDTHCDNAEVSVTTPQSSHLSVSLEAETDLRKIFFFFYIF